MAESISVEGICNKESNYPFSSSQKQPFDHYRQHIYLRPQLRYFNSLFRLRHSATLGFHQYFDKNGFIGIHTPIITSNDCEGGGEVFSAQTFYKNNESPMKENSETNNQFFFDTPALLTVSGQLHLEAVTRYS